jgi:putative transposase
VVLAGVPLHVVHRGNRQQAVFADDFDRTCYLQTVGRYAARFGLELWAYCLMTNHVHWIVQPRERSSLARTIASSHREHAVAVNRRGGWRGHLWANRHFSTVLDERHLWSAVRYVERNPVRAGLVRRAEDYPWSSAAAHCERRFDPILAPTRPFPGVMERWADWLRDDYEDAGEIDALRRNSRTGRPTGSAAFVAGLELELQRTLSKGKKGTGTF